MTDPRPTVLLLCRHNAGRSQLGASLLAAELNAGPATPGVAH